MDIQKKVAEAEISNETEADSLWKAMSVIDTNLTLLRKEFEDRMRK